MGVLSDVADLDGLKEGVQINVHGKLLKTAEQQNNQSRIVAQNIERLHLDFFLKLKEHKDDLTKIPTDYLIQFAYVLGMTCQHDPKKYFGYNLLEELHTRARKALEEAEDLEFEPPIPQFPALVSVLCHLKDFRIINELETQEKVVMSLLHPDIEDYAGDKLVEFGVERASMNIMAAKCLYKRSEVFGKNKTSEGNLVLNRILLDNSRYLNSVQEEDGGFGTFHKTALALHSQRFTPIQCCLKKTYKYSTFREKAATEWLVDAQDKENGGFGSSITFTSLAILSLAPNGQFADLQNLDSINCEKTWANKMDQKGIVVQISDQAFSKLTFIQRLEAKVGQNLKMLLDDYAKANPKIIDIEGKVIEDRFYEIESINGLGEYSDDTLFGWTIYKVFKNGSKEKINDLRSEEIKDLGDVYLLEFK